MKSNKARFGWSYHERLDLRLLAQKAEDKKSFDNEEDDAYRSIMFLRNVKINDFLIYPNIPRYGEFVICRVTGEYGFDEGIEVTHQDFRSYRPCLLVTPTPINRADRRVPPYIRKRMGLQGRIFRIHEDAEFQMLLKSIESLELGEIEQDVISRVQKKLDQTLEETAKNIARNFPGKDFSKFIYELFKQTGYDVVYREGPYEQGSDLIVRLGSELIEEAPRIGVQVAAYSGNVSKETLVLKRKQLLSGWDVNGLSFGLLVISGEVSVAAMDELREYNEIEKKKERPRFVKLIGESELLELLRTRFSFDPRFSL